MTTQPARGIFWTCTLRPNNQDSFHSCQVRGPSHELLTGLHQRTRSKTRTRLQPSGLQSSALVRSHQYVMLKARQGMAKATTGPVNAPMTLFRVP